MNRFRRRIAWRVGPPIGALLASLIVCGTAYAGTVPIAGSPSSEPCPRSWCLHNGNYAVSAVPAAGWNDTNSVRIVPLAGSYGPAEVGLREFDAPADPGFNGPVDGYQAVVTASINLQNGGSADFQAFACYANAGEAPCQGTNTQNPEGPQSRGSNFTYTFVLPVGPPRPLRVGIRYLHASNAETTSSLRGEVMDTYVRWYAVDNTPPAAELDLAGDPAQTAFKANDVTGHSVPVGVNPTDNTGVSSWSLTLDGATWASGGANGGAVPSISDGAHTLALHVCDIASPANCSDVVRHVVVDTVPPTLALPVQGPFRTARPTFHVVAADEPLTAGGYASGLPGPPDLFLNGTRIQTTAVRTSDGWNLTPTADLPDGADQSLTASISDAAGNITPDPAAGGGPQTSITIDTAAPTITNIGPPDGAVDVDPATTLEATVSDTNLAQATLFLDGNPVASDPTGSLTYNASNLASGKHTLTVTATDSAGNSSTRSWTFTARSNADLGGGGLDTTNYTDGTGLGPGTTSHPAKKQRCVATKSKRGKKSKRCTAKKKSGSKKSVKKKAAKHSTPHAARHATRRR